MQSQEDKLKFTLNAGKNLKTNHYLKTVGAGDCMVREPYNRLKTASEIPRPNRVKISRWEIERFSNDGFV